MAVGKLKRLFGLLVLVYILSPVIFRHSVFIQRSLLFMNHVNTQYAFNLSHPELLGLKCTRTLRLAYQPRVLDVDGHAGPVELGVWHILPHSSLPHCVTDHHTNRTSLADHQLAFADERPVVLYVHGNGGNRAGDHRGRLYRRLAYQHDYHIVTFDYRGYGDSTYLTPTTFGLSSDATFMYNWLLSQPHMTRERIIVWGHSLGTGVAVRMVADLPEAIQPPKLILEAPFDSIANAVANHPFSAPFRVIPYFEYFFVEPIEKSAELNFDSTSKIGSIKRTQIMIMHAEDDAIIPFKLGQNLYKDASEKLGQSRVQFVHIKADEGLGHKHICNHDSTMSKVKDFISEL